MGRRKGTSQGGRRPARHPPPSFSPSPWSMVEDPDSEEGRTPESTSKRREGSELTVDPHAGDVVVECFRTWNRDPRTKTEVVSGGSRSFVFSTSPRSLHVVFEIFHRRGLLTQFRNYSRYSFTFSHISHYHSPSSITVERSVLRSLLETRKDSTRNSTLELPFSSTKRV